MSGRPLAFRYLYKSGVIKENTVTVFGELGKVFEKGTDYDEEVDLTVPYMDLSNLIMYYTGTVADGTVGSTEEGSLRNLNAPISNVPHFRRFSNADNATGANHYYVGDIVLFDPITGSGNSTQASCWTCIRTTSDLTSPIPELANEIAAASAADGSYNTNFNGVAGRSGPGMTGIDNRGQRFIVGVMPALYSAETGVTVSPYWRESALAKSYFTEGNYYQGEIVVFNANVYRCKSTNGLMADPPLYQRERYTVAQELDPDTIPRLDLALAPSGAFGFDSSGTRYLMGVPPFGGLFSGLFWEPATLPKTPSGSYLNINWDNTSITDKIQFYDANVVGGAGGQAIPTFTDDLGNTSSTLRKIYDDNEKNFVLTVANQILSTIPAAAIKSQAINARVDPDNTLLELVNLGPTNSKPTQYTPAVQGLFEESLARDMLRISGYTNTITEIVVTDGSSGYRSVPSVQITGGLAANPKLVPYAARAVAKLGVKTIKINKSDPTWNSTTTGVRFAIGDVVTLTPTTAPTVACTAKVYRVDSAGNILSILITNRGSGYSDVASVTVRGVTRTFLEPDLEVVSVDLESRDTGFYGGMKVAVEYGSGGGAVGYAVVETVNGVVRLSGVNFDGPTQTDPTSDEVFNVSRGANYVSGNFKKDVVALQGYVYDAATSAFIPLPTARAIGFVTKTQGNAIAEIDVINNGSGYTSKPLVQIAPPGADVRNNGSIETTLTGYLATIISSGAYPSAPPVSFNPTTTPAQEVQGTAYLGLTSADVKLGGSGFSQGEVMSVSGGGIVPAKFNVTHDSVTDTYSALVMEGGDGYSVDSTKTYMNQIILQNDAVGAPVGDELRAEILSVGGGIVDIQFNAGRPTGAGFTVGDVISVADPVGGDFRFTVTGVGNEGTIAPTGFTIVDEQSITAGGFSVNQTLVARSKFLSVDTITLNTPQPISQTQPTVVIEAPTGSHTDGLGQTLPTTQATAIVSLKIDNISVANGGSGYRLGDIITLTQTGAVTCEAIVLALANNDTGSVGVVAVRTTGSLFDLSKTGNDAIKVNLPTNSGTDLQVGITYAIDRIVVTNPGVGYLVNPVATLDVGGSSATLAVTTKKFGGSTATFRVTAVDALGMPTITPLSPGSGYLVGDILSLLDSGSGVTSGAFITVNSTQSRGLRTGTMIPGYRGSRHVVSENLITGTCTKIGSPGTVFPPILYSVTKVTPPNSISRLRIVDYKPASARYANPTSLSHKPHAVVKVASVDALGSILSLVVESKGYGYTSLPTIKPLPQTRGTGASLFAVSLGVSRVEFTGAPLNTITGTEIVVNGRGLPDAISNSAATAVAQLAGDLNTISTDGLKNPNILDTLETLKPGSTSGYAQAKPNMGVSSVTVVAGGGNYNATNDSNGNPVTFVEVTAPDLPNGVLPTFAIQFDGLFGIASINVLTSGSGYSKLPKAQIKMSSNQQPSRVAEVTLNMKLLDGYMISGGEGYTNPPTVTVSPPDLNLTSSQATLIPTLRKNINGFEIISAGSQYISPPTALVVGPGGGAAATATMGISDIYVVKGGSGYAVGDMLVFPTPSGGKSAIATVVAVTEGTGAIRRVTFTRSMFPIVAATLSTRKNDFLLNGGSGYLTIPTVSPTAKVPSGSTADLYNTDGSLADGLVSSTGTGAEFSVRLGVQNLTFTSAGNNYESDATVLIQEPPSSQAANFSAIINGAGQLNAFVKLTSGSGYTRPPGVIVQGGNGAGASVTPLMGVSEVAIVNPGLGYSVGDPVTFTGGDPIEAARGVVTVVDKGTPTLGRDLEVTVERTTDDVLVSVDATGNLSGKIGTITELGILVRGNEFEIGDVITVKPERILPSQTSLNALRAIRGHTTLVGGKLATIGLFISPGTPEEMTYKAGMILKVTSNNPLLSTAVAYIRINSVYNERTWGAGYESSWFSVEPFIDDSTGAVVTTRSNSLYISDPTKKYGTIYPGQYWDFNAGTRAVRGGTAGGIEMMTVIASNAQWGTDRELLTSGDYSFPKKLNFEVMTHDNVRYPDSQPYFKIVNADSGGAVFIASPCTETGTLTASTGLFFSGYDLLEYTAAPRGRISFVQILNPGSGYQSMPTASVSASGSGSQQAQLLATLGVVGLRIDQRGAGYLSNPEIVIEAPHHRSLVAQAYARSGVFDIDVHTYDVIDQGSGYTGNSLTADGEEEPGGVYRLVGGALHQTDGAAQSVDTELIMLPGAFVGGKLSTTSGTVAAATTISIRGSNYRVGDIVSITPVKSTTSGNQATPARIRIKQISKMLDINNGLSNNGANRTGAGILDYGLQQNGEDIGAYGTGYYQPPKVTIFGGNQGVTLATSLGVVAIDLRPDEGATSYAGSDYQVGDLVQMISPEFSNPVDIGVVSRVGSYFGTFEAATLYEPFSKGLKELPTLSIKRRDPTHRYPANVSTGFAKQEAFLVPVLGVTVAGTTTSIDGFIGDPYIYVSNPTGLGYVQQPRTAMIKANLVTEVSRVDVFYTSAPPEYVTSVPRITIAQPPSIERFSGWRSVRFNKNDSFEVVVQYTIAKAISFQVDPDASLPSSYFTATSITIGGVNIPLRQAGGKGMQGRELSANRIIRRYKIKFIAV